MDRMIGPAEMEVVVERPGSGAAEEEVIVRSSSICLLCSFLCSFFIMSCGSDPGSCKEEDWTYTDSACNEETLTRTWTLAADCEGGVQHPESETIPCSTEDPCLGVTCSDHGDCIESGGVASCDCENGYYAQGLSCVPESGPRTSAEVAEDTISYILNPGIGWQEDVADDQPGHPGHTVVYRRGGSPYLGWREFYVNEAVEPGDADDPDDPAYDWSILDDAVEAADAQGKQLHFRIPSMRGEGFGGHQMPAWLVAQEPGVVGSSGSEGTYYDDEPNYERRGYQVAWAAFNDALRKRYDGDPRIYAVDIAGYGDFNEWSYLDHVHSFTNTPSSPANTNEACRIYLTHVFTGGSSSSHRWILADGSVETQVSYSHAGWSQTQLLMPHAGIRHHTAWVLVTYPEVGVRQDILGESPSGADHWTDNELGGEFVSGMSLWDHVRQRHLHAPVVYELAANNQDHAAQKQVLADSHGSLVHVNGNHGTQDQIEDVLRLAGYRFALTEAEWNSEAAPGGTLGLIITVINRGYAPAYTRTGQDFEAVVGLRSAGGDVIHEWVLAADPNNWMPSDPVTEPPPSYLVAEPLEVPATASAGDYTVTFGVRDPRTSAFIRLANSRPARNSDGRYDLGLITVQ